MSRTHSIDIIERLQQRLIFLGSHGVPLRDQLLLDAITIIEAQREQLRALERQLEAR